MRQGERQRRHEDDDERRDGAENRDKERAAPAQPARKYATRDSLDARA